MRLAQEFRERNRTALLNLLSDGTIALTGFILLLRNSDGRGALFRTIGRIFSGFSDTAKAFLIIASAFLSSHAPAYLCMKEASSLPLPRFGTLVHVTVPLAPHTYLSDGFCCHCQCTLDFLSPSFL